MRETLPRALTLMFGHEGGYVNAATDRGGPTKYGITHAALAAYRGVKSVTAAQVKELTLAEVIADAADQSPQMLSTQALRRIPSVPLPFDPKDMA